MAFQSVPLTAVEEAYCAIVLERHAAEVRGADARKNDGMAILLADKGIPAEFAVNIRPRTGDAPACFTYDDGVTPPVDPTITE